MRNRLLSVLLAGLGIAGVLVLGHGRADAQQEPDVKLPDAFPTAPAKGIAMIQDEKAVYIYDGSEKKLVVVSKNSWREDGKPVTHVINIAKLKPDN